jgi:hypothetical protein
MLETPAGVSLSRVNRKPPAALKNHLTNIFDKTATSNRLELSLFATHHHLV